MNAAEELLDDLITLEVFHQQTKITKKAVYEKISKGVWTEGKEFFRDPQRRIWISRSGYQQWIISGSQKPTQQALNQERRQFKSSSGSKVKLTTVTKHSSGAPPQLT
jgi:hypothetical protein